jgi:hypothetical protein
MVPGWKKSCPELEFSAETVILNAARFPLSGLQVDSAIDADV